MKKIIIQAAFLAGVGLMNYGFWSFNNPLGCITSGLCIVTLAVGHHIESNKKS